MAIKVGINGFGRIGRVVLRIMIEHPEQFDICGINLRKADLDYMVYMIKYDSVFRQFNGTVEHKDKNLIVNGHTIQVFSEFRRGDDPLVQLRRGVHHRVPPELTTPPRRPPATSRAARRRSS